MDSRLCPKKSLQTHFHPCRFTAMPGGCLPYPWENAFLTATLNSTQLPCPRQVFQMPNRFTHTLSCCSATRLRSKRPIDTFLTTSTLAPRQCFCQLTLTQTLTLAFLISGQPIHSKRLFSPYVLPVERSLHSPLFPYFLTSLWFGCVPNE